MSVAASAARAQVMAVERGRVAPCAV